MESSSENMRGLRPSAPVFVPRYKIIEDEQRHFEKATDPLLQPLLYQAPIFPDIGPMLYEVRGDDVSLPIPMLRVPNRRFSSEPSSITPSLGVTANQIKFQRRFYFHQKERPNALAIIDPKTKEVLLPGKAKITKEEEAFQRNAALEADNLNQSVFEKQRYLRTIAAIDRALMLEATSQLPEPYLPPTCPYHFAPIIQH